MNHQPAPDATRMDGHPSQHHEQGTVVADYDRVRGETIQMLNRCAAAEIVSVLRYTFHALVAASMGKEAIAAELRAHADEEATHLDWISVRIKDLGGRPDMRPKGLLSRAATQWGSGSSLASMLEEDLAAERVEIGIYGKLSESLEATDPTTHALLERIRTAQQKHADSALSSAAAPKSRLSGLGPMPQTLMGASERLAHWSVW